MSSEGLTKRVTNKQRLEQYRPVQDILGSRSSKYKGPRTGPCLHSQCQRKRQRIITRFYSSKSQPQRYSFPRLPYLLHRTYQNLKLRSLFLSICIDHLSYHKMTSGRTQISCLLYSLLTFHCLAHRQEVSFGDLYPIFSQISLHRYYPSSHLS